jgi:hypothetical protein
MSARGDRNATFLARYLNYKQSLSAFAQPRKRGSLTDSVNLLDYPFVYEPAIKDKEITTFGFREVLGNRLPNTLWVGQGSCSLDLEVFLLGVNSTLSRIQDFKSLLDSQDDIGAPHPLFVNIGSIYVGRLFVLTEVEAQYVGLSYDDSLTPFEVVLKLKLVEISKGPNFAGTGA